MALCYRSVVSKITAELAEFKGTGKDDGVIHWRSLVAGEIGSLLTSSLNMSREALNELLKLGAVYENNLRCSNDRLFSESRPSGSYFRIHTQPRRYNLQDFKFEVLFENSDFLVAHKPSGLPSHAMVDNVRENLQYAIEQKVEQKLFLTHRLDVPTEGLIVYAKNKKFLSHFNQLLADRKVKKFYRLFTEKDVPFIENQILQHHMLDSVTAPKVLSLKEVPRSKICQLRICKTISSREISVELLTGRTHQIRAQMGFENCPIVGDTMYGGKTQPWGQDQIALMAEHLEFENFTFSTGWQKKFSAFPKSDPESTF